MKLEQRGSAVAFMILATAFIALATLAAKAVGTDALGPPLPAFMVSFGRFLFGFLVLLALAAHLRPRIYTTQPKTHLIRIFCGWGGVTLMFAAVTYIPMSDAAAISFLNPVFCMMFAIPLLGERVGPIRWFAATVSLIGAVILLRPGADTLQFGALLALGAAVMLGMELIFIKRLTRSETTFQILLIANGVGLIFSGITAATVWQTPTLLQWLGMGATGCAMVCAQGAFTTAMSRAEASFITPFSYLTLVFAALYDAIIFGTRPDVISWLGAATIIAGAALLAWREAVNRRRQPAHPASQP